MNERIQELAVQAEGTKKHVPAVWQFYDHELEKFAELIVKECTQLLFDESERLYTYSSECDIMRDSDEAELSAEKCMDNIETIEKHFGVE